MYLKPCAICSSRNINARKSFDLRPIYRKKKICHQSIKTIGCRIWNNLPMKCKTAISSYSLKNQLKLYFMET